jgi:hypothetical protein
MAENFENEENSIFSITTSYTSLPTANALIPINPVKIPFYYMGSVLPSDQRVERNDVMQPWRTIESSFEYL